MECKKIGGVWVVRLDKGDEIKKSLNRFCEENGIKSGYLQGFGTTDHLEIGLLDTATKEYIPSTFAESMEIVSLLGTVSQLNGEVYIHMHIAVGREDSSVIGGHLDEARVSATAEIFVHELDGCLGRKFDEHAGVNQLVFA